jgi:hypothetical protein
MKKIRKQIKKFLNEIVSEKNKTEFNYDLFIKNILIEETERIDVEKRLKSYTGDIKILGDLLQKLQKGVYLSDEEIEVAKKELEILQNQKNTMNNTPNISKLIKSSKDLQSKVKSLGIKTYKDLIRTDKKILLNTLLKNTKFRIDSPNEAWYQRNIDDLKILRSRFKSSVGNIRWPDGSISTFDEKITEMIDKCKNKDFFGILEKDGDEDVWSITNKLDTNYSNWAEMIEDRQKEGLIFASNYETLILEYFKQRPIDEAITDNELRDKIKDIQKTENISINTFSFAESDIIEAFQDESNLKLKNIFDRLSSTTREGEYVEKNFKELIKDRPKYVEDLHDFSSWGNIVDMVFGIDLIVKLNGTEYAVQVKKDQRHAENKYITIKKLGINYVIIYPLPSGKGKYYFGYISPKQPGGNFTEDFRKLIQSENEENKKGG